MVSLVMCVKFKIADTNLPVSSVKIESPVVFYPAYADHQIMWGR